MRRRLALFGLVIFATALITALVMKSTYGPPGKSADAIPAPSATQTATTAKPGIPPAAPGTAPSKDATKGWIVGQVSSKDGEPIAGARLIISATDGAHLAASGEKGAFAVLATPGPYRVEGVGPAGERLRAGGGLLAIDVPSFVDVRSSDYLGIGLAYERERVNNARLEDALRQERAARVAEVRPPAPAPTPAPAPVPAPSPVPAPAPIPEEPMIPPAPPVAASVEPVEMPTREGDAPCVQGEPCKLRLYYGTNRAQVPNNGKAKVQYTRERGGRIAYGEVLVSVPGNYERFSGKLDLVKGTYVPGKSFFIEEVTRLDDGVWMRNLQARVEKDAGRSMIVFVHGFNVSFENAARRTAQIHYDLQSPGAPVFFAWPSRTGILKYWADEASVELSAAPLREFLDRVAKDSGAKTIHVIAHSMGSRALTRALADIGNENQHKSERHPGERVAKFSKVFLAAPDLDTEVFQQLHAAVVGKSADTITIYASNRDRTMFLSRLLHIHPRLGQPLKQWTPIEGVDAVDATKMRTDFLGHSYYGNTILRDIRVAVAKPTVPIQQRCTITTLLPNGYYAPKPPDALPNWLERLWLALRRKRPETPLEQTDDCIAELTEREGRVGG